MKLALEKISIGDGHRKFKVKIMNNTSILSRNSKYSDVEILTNNNAVITNTSNSYKDFNNNVLMDIDAVNKYYYSESGEDNTGVILPIFIEKDITQFSNYDFSLTTETASNLKQLTYPNKLIDKYTDQNEQLIIYDDSKFDDINIESNMTESEVMIELQKIFGSANSLGTDADFIKQKIVKINDNISIQQSIDSLPFSYILETNIDNPQNVGLFGDIQTNFFKTKNHVKNDYNIYTKDNELVAWRRYRSINNSNELLWMAYKVNFADNYNNEYLTRNYETVDHINSLIKYKISGGHKSNIFSIRIKNSGLTKEGELYSQIRNIFEKNIFNLITKIAPVHTQLWKIEYIDD